MWNWLDLKTSYILSYIHTSQRHDNNGAAHCPKSTWNVSKKKMNHIKRAVTQGRQTAAGGSAWLRFADMVLKINLREGFPCEITKIWSESRKAKQHSGASYTSRSKKATSVLDWRHGNELCSTEAFEWKTRDQKYKQTLESKGLFTRPVTGGTAKQVSRWSITCFFLQGIIKFPCTDTLTSIQRLKPKFCSRCPLSSCIVDTHPLSPLQRGLRCNWCFFTRAKTPNLFPYPVPNGKNLWSKAENVEYRLPCWKGWVVSICNSMKSFFLLLYCFNTVYTHRPGWVQLLLGLHKRKKNICLKSEKTEIQIHYRL